MHRYLARQSRLTLSDRLYACMLNKELTAASHVLSLVQYKDLSSTHTTTTLNQVWILYLVITLYRIWPTQYVEDIDFQLNHKAVYHIAGKFGGKKVQRIWQIVHD